MDLQISGAGGAISDDIMDAYEKRIGQAIPPSYRTFLGVHNGGRPFPPNFPMLDSQRNQLTWGSVMRFLGVHVEQENEIEHVLWVYRNRLPYDLFPIARDPGGNLICLSTGDVLPGKVYFWDHEFEAAAGEPTSSENVYLIANGFSEFLSMLRD